MTEEGVDESAPEMGEEEKEDEREERAVPGVEVGACAWDAGELVVALEDMDQRVKEKEKDGNENR